MTIEDRTIFTFKLSDKLFQKELLDWKQKLEHKLQTETRENFHHGIIRYISIRSLSFFISKKFADLHHPIEIFDILCEDFL